jgi:hypothetical protein
MGAWGHEPWDNDSAADWFKTFFEGIDVDARIDAALQFDEDNSDEVRAAAYVLQVLGRVYVWPGDINELGKRLDRAISLLEKMVDPADEVGEEMIELWGEGSAVFDSIRRQIEELKLRRSQGNWD